MKTLYIILFSLMAPLCAIGQDKTYIIGTALGDITNLQAWSNGTAGFYKMRDKGDSNTISYILHADIGEDIASSSWIWDLWFSHYKRPVLDVSLSQLSSLGAIDVESLIGRYSMSKESMLSWAKSISGYPKKVYVIDRNDFYKSSPSLSQPDMMKVREVFVAWDMPDVHYTFYKQKYPPRLLFETHKSNHYNLISNCNYINSLGYGPRMWPTVLEKRTLLQYPNASVDIEHYGNTKSVNKATGYDMITVHNGSLWARYKMAGQFAKLRNYSTSSTNRVAAAALNPYFVEIPYSMGSLVVVIGKQQKDGCHRLVIIAVYGDDVQIVFDRDVTVDSLTVNPTFNLVMNDDSIRIYEENGKIFLFE